MKIIRGIEIGNKIEETIRLQTWAEEIATDFDMDTASLFDFQLCLDELVSNIINYAYTPGSEQRITVNYMANDILNGFEIIDSGAPFNMLEKAEPDVNKKLSSMEIGGLGIFLLKKLMDHIEYERENNHNKLRIYKKRKKQE